MEACMAPGAPLSPPLERIRRLFAVLMARDTCRKPVTDREEVNRQAERLLTDYGNSVLRLAYSYLHNMSDAEEVLQDTLIRFLKAALPRLPERSEPEPPVLAVPNIVEAASIQELSGLVGFEVTTDFSLPFEAEEITYCSYWNEMTQIQYSGGGCSATYRQSMGTGDNSGDYNTYSDTMELVVNGQNIALKGDGGMYVLAVWTDGTCSCSLSISPGVSAEDWYTIKGI